MKRGGTEEGKGEGGQKKELLYSTGYVWGYFVHMYVLCVECYYVSHVCVVSLGRGLTICSSFMATGRIWSNLAATKVDTGHT